MPWRLIGCILIAAIFLGFIGLNLENRCDISLGFYTFTQVPVFLSALASLLLGMLLALPLSIAFRRKPPKGKKKSEPAISPRAGELRPEGGPGGPHGAT
jgi:uncharacterized integral membrane protein